jgi:hypothetical protein
METYIVLYRDEGMIFLDEPLGFMCEAEDVDHAEEQCRDAYPNCETVWVYKGDDMAQALSDYDYSWE